MTILIMLRNILITMSNLLFYTDTKSTKTYGNGKSGLDNYILKKKSEWLELIGTDN